jgi:hypothetical protein
MRKSTAWDVTDRTEGARRRRPRQRRKAGLVTAALAFATLVIAGTIQSVDATQVSTTVNIFGRQFQARNGGTPYALAYTSNVAHFQVRPGDTYYPDDGRQRSELVECPLRTRLLTNPISASFSVKVDGNVTGDSANDFTTIQQIHQDRIPNIEPDSTPKPPALTIGFWAGGTFSIAVRGDGHVPTSDATRVYTPVYTAPWTYASQWVSMSYEAHFGPTGNGSLRVWLNGKVIVDRTGLTFGYTGIAAPNRPQVQFGIYRSAIPTQLDVTYANVAIADPPGVRCK